MDRQRRADCVPAKISNDENDRLLLRQIARGDRAAFRQLYEAYYYPLLHFMRRVTGQLELAEEAINDVMLVVWRSAESFGGRSKVSTWIMGIGYHKALKVHERSRRWVSRFKAAAFDDWLEHEVAAEPSDGIDLRDLLERGLSRLSPEQRAVVELTYFAGCSYEDIAVIAGCPVNTVKTRMFHARAKLRKLLPALGAAEPAA